MRFLYRRALFAAMLACAGAQGALSAPAADVYVQLFPLTGEIRLRNKDATALSLAYYSLGSTTGTLNGSPLLWNSISDKYDVSGNGFIDPVSNWTKLSSSATELAEGVFSGPGGSLAAERAISLGKIWTPSLTPGLSASVQNSSGVSANVTFEFALDGDYFRDGVVDQLDLDRWLQTFGSTTPDADGSLNGVVDAADYAIWRNNLGKSIPTLIVASGSGLVQGAGLLASAAVPEPASALLLGAACGAWLMSVRARRRSL